MKFQRPVYLMAIGTKDEGGRDRGAFWHLSGEELIADYERFRIPFVRGEVGRRCSYEEYVSELEHQEGSLNPESKKVLRAYVSETYPREINRR